MRASIVIAAHNEGALLRKTLQSCRETLGRLRCEVVIVDDASTDGCVAEAADCFPDARVFRHQQRRGGPASKDRAASTARGDTLVFLDGHCKPARWALERLVNDVEDLAGEAIVVPAIPGLDSERWENSRAQVGFGYSLDLETFGGKWLNRTEMRQNGRFYESPALVGCSVAVSRELYGRLRGFDADMLQWGIEDMDLGLKAWLMGHPVLNDPRAVVGHRFRQSFDNISVSGDAVLANQLRMARKNFGDEVWEEWTDRLKSRLTEEGITKAWAYFTEKRASVEAERQYLFENRVRDEYWYAERFGLPWPSRPRH